MPTFTFTSPEGKKYTVNGPEGATQDQAFQMLQSQIGSAQAAPAAEKTRGFGEYLNDSIADVPRSLGLFGRYALEGVGGIADIAASPFRAGLNAAGADIRGNSGAALADAIGLPSPRTATERVIGDASRLVAGGAVPIGAGAALASRGTGVAQGVGKMLAANPAQQLTSAAAAGGAGGYTRETGGNDAAQLVAALGAGVAAPFAANGLAKAGQAARTVIAGRSQPSAQQIEITINNALQPSGMSLSSLPSDIAATIRKDVAEAYKLSDSLTPDAVRRLADYRLVGATPTQARLTLQPGDITRQENLSKLGVNSRDPLAQELANTKSANNKVLTEGLNGLGASTADDQIAGASRVMGALDARNSRAKAVIDQSYQAARDTQGRSASLDPSAFTNRANNLLDEALLGGKLPGDVRNLLNRAATGEMPLTVDVAEQFKTRIGELQRSTADAAERKALGLVRNALDDTPLLPGQKIGQESIAAFNKARALNRSWMKIVERTPALQAVRDGIEPDKFVQQYIVGSGPKSNVMDVAQLKSSIKSSPDAMDAVKEQITSFLKQKATNGATDEVANFSQSAYNKALNQIGERKLKLFFSQPEIDKLKALGRVASYEQVQPVGSAVNNSNTAGTLGAGLLDRLGGSPLLSKIPFGRAAIGDPLQNIVISQQSGRALNTPLSLIGGPAERAVQGQMSRIPAISPALLMGFPEDDRQR